MGHHMVRLGLENGSAVEADVAVEHCGRFRRRQAHNGLERGGFSRAVGADKGDNFALFHMKRDAVKGFDLAIAGVQIFNFQQHYTFSSPR